MPAAPAFIFDTSCFINGWHKLYPPALLPQLWPRIAESIEQGLVGVPREVLAEIQRQDDDLWKWTAPWRHTALEPDQQVTRLVGLLQVEFPAWVNPESTRSSADPFVVAHAIELRATVVTEEQARARRGLIKIPTVCQARKVRCMNLLEFLLEQGWTFR